MPVGYVLVGDAGGDVKHNDCALTLNVVSIAETAKLLLTGRIPHVESQWAAIGVEDERMHLNAQCRHVFLFKLTSQMTFHKSRLADTTIANKHQFKSGHLLLSHLSVFTLVFSHSVRQSKSDSKMG